MLAVDTRQLLGNHRTTSIATGGPVRTIVTTLALAATLIAVPAPAQASPGGSGDVYVSPHGSDFGPGTWWLPLRTVQKARDLVRTRTRKQVADLTVHLAPGTYRLTKPL